MYSTLPTIYHIQYHESNQSDCTPPSSGSSMFSTSRFCSSAQHDASCKRSFLVHFGGETVREPPNSGLLRSSIVSGRGLPLVSGRERLANITERKHTRETTRNGSQGQYFSRKIICGMNTPTTDSSVLKKAAAVALITVG